MNAVQPTNEWLSYSISPRDLGTELLPAMWGNGQLELLAELHRPCVSEVVCFGFGEEGLYYGARKNIRQAEEHLVPAVFDADSGKKYFLHSSPSSHAEIFTVTFRPDRHTWRYVFDDLVVDVALILPRMQPGYLFKVEIEPGPANASRRWIVCHEVRGFFGEGMRATAGACCLDNGSAWFKNSDREHGEAMGATVDALAINLGQDGPYARDIMAKTPVETAGEERAACVYLARAFGVTPEEAREVLSPLLEAPGKLEEETEAWWNRYLAEVPRLETPDESFNRNFLWSWPNFRMNRIDLPRGEVPAGLFYSNNVSLKPRMSLGLGGDGAMAESIQLLHDPAPTRDITRLVLHKARKHGVFSGTFWCGRENPGAYYSWLCYASGLLHKYILTTGDSGILSEDIGAMTILERLEDALDAQLPFRDKKTGLYRTVDEAARSAGGTGGLGPNMEAIVRHRGAKGVFYNDSSAAMYGTLLALADLEDLVGNHDKRERYRHMAEELREAIQRHLWNEENGFFCDLGRDGSFTDYMGIGGFWTGLYCNQVYRPGGVATPEQAERLAQWCNHPDFVSDYGVISLARSHPYYDPEEYKGFSGGFDMHWCMPVAAGLYAHGCYEEAHRQLFKLWRRFGENGGLGPRYRGESHHADTGEILPWRFPNYPCELFAVNSITDGVFGMRWTTAALTVHVNSPWPRVRLSNLRMRDSLLDLELTGEGTLVATIDGKEAARSDDRRLALAWAMFA